MREPEVPAPDEGEMMSEQAQQYASLPWIPDEDKRTKYEEKDGKIAIGENPVEGVVSGHSTRDNFAKTGKYNVVTITTDDGREVAIHCQPTVLARQMLDARPKYGERITCAFLGVVQGANFATPYANYSVKVHREAGGEIAWAGATPDEAVHVVYDQQATPPPAPAPAPAAPAEPAPSSQNADDDFPF